MKYSLFQVNEVLAEYPCIWMLTQHRRERIIHAYRACGSFTGRGGSGVHSDQTFEKVSKLLESDQYTQWVEVIGEWLNHELEPHNRWLLLERWRGYSWQFIAHRRGVQVWQLMKQWESMINSLIAYQIVFVGHAREQGGSAFAVCQ